MPVQNVARNMLELIVGGLPVVDSDNRLVGIITESNIFRMLIDQWDYFTTQHADLGPVATMIAQEMGR